MSGNICHNRDRSFLGNNIIYSFGLNGPHGALGQPGAVEELPVPTPIDVLTGKGIIDAATGWGHTLALSGMTERIRMKGILGIGCNVEYYRIERVTEFEWSVSLVFLIL